MTSFADVEESRSGAIFFWVEEIGTAVSLLDLVLLG
jgi:hypothetical protein